MAWARKNEHSSSERPACSVWGVLNVTPDSFSDGGSFHDEGGSLNVERAIAHGVRMLLEGAAVIDVGGESSRPTGQTYGAGAVVVPADEEIRRVVPVIERLVREHRAVVSIDTIKPAVAEAAIAAGATLVNDVSCGRDDALLAVVARAGVDLVLMHTRGRGEVIAPHTDYDDVVSTVARELMLSVNRAEGAGVERGRIWIDPGLGFAKTAAQSLELLARVSALVSFGHRVLVGASRKAFLAETAPLASGERPSPTERDASTLAAVTSAVLSGAHAVRVHDVRGAQQAVRLALAIREARAHDPRGFA